jgi:catechol 2,3-dioxygenase-like lactoylglutathione lyase family enzyme
MPDLQGLDHIEFTVRDPELSVEWYERVLGFTLRADYRREKNGVIVMVHRSGLMLGFWRHGERPATEPFDEFRTGLDHLAFKVARREDIDEWAAHFASQGVDYSDPVDVGPYGVIVTFRDPDNVQLEVHWRPT